MGPWGLHGLGPMGQGRWAGADGPQGPKPRGPPRGGAHAPTSETPVGVYSGAMWGCI